MFKEYFMELKDLQVYETNEGFILYRITPQHLYLADVYVKPEFRRQGNAFSMADDLVRQAKEIGVKYLLCDVEPSNINATASVKVILAYGCEIAEAHQDEIIFIKEL